MRFNRLLLIALALAASGCGSVMRSAQNSLATQLTTAALEHDDVATVASALPAYLLLLDAGVQSSPNDGASLCSAAKLYGAYSGGMVSDPERQRRLALRAFGYGQRGACALHGPLCDASGQSFDDLGALAGTLQTKQLPALACLAGAWANVVQANSDSPEAQADIPKVRVLYERIAELDPAYGRGEAQMALGVLNSLLPAAFGGKPELGKAYFEKAIELGDGHNLMAKVLYAQYYGRLTFNQELHDRLLKEVSEAPAQAPSMTLMNQIAKQRALELAASGKDYF